MHSAAAINGSPRAQGLFSEVREPRFRACASGVSGLFPGFAMAFSGYFQGS